MYARILASVPLLVACLTLVPSPTRAEPPREPMLVRSYPVADLVVPMQGMPMPAAAESKAKTPTTLEDRLIRLLTQTIEPGAWQSKGGRGVIDYYPLGMALVINQTPTVHERVAELLAALRRLQNVQVSLEIRVVSVAEECPERIGVDFHLKQTGSAEACEPPPCKPTSGGNCLNAIQTAHLLETAQSDRRTNVLQAPKLTMLNGQTGTICTPGFRMTARPIVSADRRFVQVALDFEQTEPGMGKPTMLTLNRTMTIPDGGTALCGGLKRVIETRTECGLPVLNRIPYVNRLFRNVGYGRETQTLLVMVTPRIIITEEEEAKVMAVPGSAASEKSVPDKVSRQDKVVADLLRAYEAACADGKSAEARKYARAALAIDPTCFRKNP